MKTVVVTVQQVDKGKIYGFTSIFKTLDKIETHNMTVAYGQPGHGKTSLFLHFQVKSW